MNKRFLQLLFLFLLENTISVLGREEKLKILFVIDVFPSSIQKNLLDQIIWFSNNGHYITVLANQNNKNSITNIWLEEIKHYKVFDKVLYEYIPKNINTFDIIYCAEYKLTLRFVKFKKITKNIFPKLITVIEDSEIIDLKNNKIDLDVITEIDLIIAKCQYMAEILAKYGCDDKKIKVMIGIDCEQYYQVQEKKIIQDINIVTIPALYGKNRLWYVLEAVEKLLDKGYNIKYTIIGKGWNEKKLLSKIQSSRFQKNIFIKQNLPIDKINEILNSSHIFFLPGLKTEGIPFCLLQAMAKNVLVVTSCQEGISELIINGKTGLIVKYKNSIVLANILENIITSYNKIASNITSHARKYIEVNHNHKILTKDLENIFYQLVADTVNIN